MSERELTHEEQVRNQSLLNLKAWTLLYVGFLKEKNQISDFTAHFTKILLPGWQNEVSNAKEFCDQSALNNESHGSTILNVSGNEQTAEMTFTDIFTDDDLKLFNVTIPDIDEWYHSLMKSLAQGLNLKYTWSRNGNKTTAKVQK